MNWHRALDSNIVAGIGLLLVVVSLLFAVAGLLSEDENMIVAGSGLSTVGVIIFAIWQFNRTEQNRLSKEFLDAALLGYRKGLESLEEGAQDRANWIRAARLLARGMEAKGQISNEEHVSLFDVEVEHIRIEIDAHLREKPVEFFFGVEDDGSLPANGTDRTFEAAVRSHRRTSASGLHRTSSSQRSTELSSDAIYTIMQAAAFPEDYVDKLRRAPKGYAESLLSQDFIGLRSFLSFKDLYLSLPDGTIMHKESREIVYRSRRR